MEMFIAVLLYGVTTAQTYLYWFNFPDDPAYTRWTVATVWVVETIHTVFCLHAVYGFFITNFGNIDGVLVPEWSAGASVLLAVVIAALVQVFFIRRIYILSQRSILVTAIPSVSLFFRVAFGTATSIFAWIVPTWVAFHNETGPYVTTITGLSLASVTDIIIASLMIYYLYNSRTGILSTDHLLKVLMTYCVNTGAATMVTSLVIVITYLKVENSMMFAGFVEIQSKLYSNSFLATLNARKTLINNNNRPVAEFSSTELSGRTGRSNQSTVMGSCMDKAQNTYSEFESMTVEESVSVPSKHHILV